MASNRANKRHPGLLLEQLKCTPVRKQQEFQNNYIPTCCILWDIYSATQKVGTSI